jgi:rubrerythrin
MTTLNRSEFLSRGAKGGIALVAGGTLLATSTGPAAAQGGGDADIAALAATAELLAIDFYGRALRSGRFRGDERDYLREARVNERDHYRALAEVLGSAAPRDIRFRFPSGAFRSRRSVARLGVALETAFVGAYLGGVTALQDNDLKGVAASIAVNEGQHLSVFTEILRDDPVGPSFPRALTAAQATAAVRPFLPR